MYSSPICHHLQRIIFKAALAICTTNVLAEISVSTTLLTTAPPRKCEIFILLLANTPRLSKLKTDLQAQRVFVYQGRIALEKNIESLLRAWKQAEMGRDSKLLIVGSGPLTPSLNIGIACLAMHVPRDRGPLC